MELFLSKKKTPYEVLLAIATTKGGGGVCLFFCFFDSASTRIMESEPIAGCEHFV